MKASAYPPGDLSRLAEVKAALDPRNLFGHHLGRVEDGRLPGGRLPGGSSEDARLRRSRGR